MNGSVRSVQGFYSTDSLPLSLRRGKRIAVQAIRRLFDEDVSLDEITVIAAIR